MCSQACPDSQPRFLTFSDLHPELLKDFSHLTWLVVQAEEVQRLARLGDVADRSRRLRKARGARGFAFRRWEASAVGEIFPQLTYGKLVNLSMVVVKWDPPAIKLQFWRIYTLYQPFLMKLGMVRYWFYNMIPSGIGIEVSTVEFGIKMSPWQFWLYEPCLCWPAEWLGMFSPF